jgi:hypothetical protein
MPKVHNIGPKHFVQLIDFPVEWGRKLVVRGWTQEIEEPFRTSEPFIVRLPSNKAFVYGKWTGVQPDEETALNRALEGRVLTDEDFEEGWTAPAYKTTEEDFWDINT